MAVLKGGAQALRMDDISFDPTGAKRTGTPTQILFTYDANTYLQFDGHFQYDQFGRPSGDLDAVTSVENGKTQFMLTGVTAQIEDVFSQQTSEQAVALVLAGDDKISGRNRGDYLIGYDGDDRIYGNDGNDFLVGGHGADRLYGGADLDTFIYQSTDDSTVARAGRDTIYNFSVAEGDKIDLSAIDAIAGGTDDAFTLVNRFHGVAGELIVRETATGFLVQGDTDGINGADFSIVVTGTVAPDANSFVF